MAPKMNRTKIVLVLLVACVVLLGCCVGVLMWSRSRNMLPKSADERLDTAELERFRQAFEGQIAMPFASDPKKAKTLEELAGLNIERAKEFRLTYSNLVEYGRHYHEFYLRPRPSHEVEVILDALEDATGQTPWNRDKIEDTCDQVKYGVHDLRVLEKLKGIVENLEERYSEPESDEATGRISLEKNRALSDTGRVLRTIGYIGLPESAEYLLSLIPEKRAEIDTRWERTVVYGACYGLGNLPPHLSISSLEALYDRWFPDVPPGTIALDDAEAQGNLESILRLIDEAYRKAYNEPPLLPPWRIPGNPLDPDWPPPTCFYGPGGIKMSHTCVSVR